MTDTRKIITITGLSQVGKTTITKELINRSPNLVEPKSYVTRKPRPDDTNYTFVDGEEFRNLIKTGQLAEWVQYGNTYYGIDRTHLEELILDDKTPILPIVTEGIYQLKAIYPHVKLETILLLPENMGLCKQRMKARGMSESEQHIRVREFQKDVQQLELFKHIVVNQTDKVIETVKLIENRLGYGN